MSEVTGIEYAGVFVVTALLTLVVTPVAMRIALRNNVLDHPNAIKAQESPVPYLGGAAIVVAFSAVVLAAAIVRPPTAGLAELSIILGLGVGLSIAGLIDDLRGLSPLLRLLLEFAAGLTVALTAAGAEIFSNDALNIVVTVAWIVAVTNALNLLDNMDGLSAGVAGIAAVFLFVIAASNGQFLVATLAIALAGCAGGFLRSNFHPARIYMGDAGALFIGFLLAVLTMKVQLVNEPQLVSLALPIVLLGMPLFDTTIVSVNRILHRRVPWSGGRDHVSHRLVFVGIPVPAAVTLIYIVSASLGCMSYVLSKVDEGTALVLLGWIACLGVLLGVLLSRVPVYETSRRKHLMLQEVRRHEPGSVERPLRAAESG